MDLLIHKVADRMGENRSADHFKTDFILCSLRDAGFEVIEVIERDPYPEVEYQSRRAYVFAKKPIIPERTAA